MFGKNSLAKLSLADTRLQKVANLAMEWGIMDFAVIESFRDKITQDRYHQEGKSKVVWPDGKHNKQPAQALDIVPFINGKISWDSRHCLALSGIILAAGKVIGVPLRWGGNWDRDGEPITDQNFQDLVHYELDE